MQHSTTETFENRDISVLESCLGLGMTIASFAVSASVCSEFFTLTLMP